jgi:hypothetical protein
MKLNRKPETDNQRQFRHVVENAFPEITRDSFSLRLPRSSRIATFFKLVMRELGIDPERAVDDELIAEVREKLIAKGFDYDEEMAWLLEIEAEESSAAPLKGEK